MVGLSGTSQQLPLTKAILLFVLAAGAVSAPAAFGRIAYFREQEPAFLSIVIGLAVAVLSYVFLEVFLRELHPVTVNSTAVILGLIAAHVAVFEVPDKVPSIPVYALFLFLFYWHFDEGAVLRDQVDGEAAAASSKKLE